MNLKKIYPYLSEQTCNDLEYNFSVIAGVLDLIFERTNEEKLTTEQYAELTTLISGMIKKGEVTVSDIDKNKGLLDATFFNSEFLNQLKSGSLNVTNVLDKSITTSKIADGAITPELMSKPQYVPGKNLFDKSVAAADKIIDYKGELASAAGVTSSDFIKVKPSTSYVASQRRVVAFYDTNKKFISNITDTTFSELSNVPFITPENAQYVKVSMRTSHVDVAQVEEGKEATTYEAYGVTKLSEHRFPPVDKSVTVKSLAQETLDLIKAQKQSDELITTERIAKGAITPELMSKGEMKVGKNLFDKSKVTTDTIIDYKGDAVTAAGVSSSDFIEVKPSTTYTTTYRRVIAFYDINKKFISYIVDKTALEINKPFTTPENAAYVRLTMRNAQVDTEQLELGDVATPYESYRMVKVGGHHFPPSPQSVTLESLAQEVKDLIEKGAKEENQFDIKFRDDLEGLLFARGNEMYFADGTKLMKSTNNGTTKQMIKDFTPLKPIMVWKSPVDITKKYTLVFVGADNKADTLKNLYRSEDDITFESVLEGVKTPYTAWSSICAAQGTSNIVFADYVGTGNSSIYSSLDDGKNWQKTFTTDVVRHFHNVAYNKTETRFYVSSGDSNPNVKWYKSTTALPSQQSHWSDISLSQMTQLHRTTHMEFIDSKYILYASDATPPYYSGVYKINSTDLNDIQKIMPLNNESTTFYRAGEVVLIGTYASTEQSIKEGSLYASTDGGETFKKVFNYPLVEGQPVGGVYHVMGTDTEGTVYMRFWGAKDKPSNCIFEVKRKINV